jgi:hypothetical protein
MISPAPHEKNRRLGAERRDGHEFTSFIPLIPQPYIAEEKQGEQAKSGMPGAAFFENWPFLLPLA